MKSASHIVRTAWRYAPWAAGELTRRGRPNHLVHFYGDTPGDDLMCTVVLHELRKRGRSGIWMMSRFPELFRQNPDVDQVVPFDFRYQRLASWLGAQLLYAHYGGHDHEKDQSPIPQQHIIALMCQACGISGSVSLRPYLLLTEQEREYGRFGDRQIVVHSSGMSAASAMKNKEWTGGRFQEVISLLLHDGFTVVQVGARGDPLLEGCLDMRGKTSIRETAAIVSNSMLMLGQVGFLMHLARAVETPSVIIYGGRELPWQSGYSCNVNLHTALPCSPCWRWNTCDNPVQRECMSAISVDAVMSAVMMLAARGSVTLADDVVHL